MLVIFRAVAVTLLLLAPLATPALAQEKAAPIAKASLIADASAAALADGKPVWVALQLDVADDWHVYWQNPGDSGIPTEISWQLPSGVTASPIHWPLPERQAMSGLVNYGYSHRVILPVAITAPAGNSALKLRAKANWLVCKDICIPESAELAISLPSAQGAGAIADALLHVPTPSTPNAALAFTRNADTLEITLPEAALPSGISNIDFFPITENLIQNAAPIAWSKINDGHVILAAANADAPTQGTIRGVVKITHATGVSLLQFSGAPVDTAPSTDASAQPAPETPLALPLAMVFALLGGLLLNLMPCVLPIVAMKAFAIASKNAAPRREVVAHGVAYTLGVLASMAALGVVLYSLKTAGEAVGWGFQLQSPHVVATLATLMLLVAMHLLGWFHLPSLLTSADTSLSARKGLSGSFFTGTLSVAVATPCTAPFMAPALGAAAIMPPLFGLLVLLSLGLGLALPYLLICVWPAARKLLPKPGAWMVRFKELLAFFMLAAAVWLLWVLGHLSGSDGITQLLIAFVLLGFAVWLARGKTNAVHWVFIVAACIGALIIGIVSQPSVANSRNTNSAHNAMMQNVTQVPYSKEALANLRAEGKAVFVDATADWCITCKVNERVALRDEAVQDYFNQHDVVLMVADWTMRDSAIAEYLASFGRNGVPLYVWYAPNADGVVLPQLLTPSRVLDALSADLQ